MRAWQLTDDTGTGPLRLVTLTDPQPGPGEVVVRTRAVALNYRDLVVAGGGYQRRVPVGAIPCSDAAGEIVATGAGVPDVLVGDRVTSVFAPDWVSGGLRRAALRTTLGAGQAPGVLAELVVLPASAVLPITSPLTFEEAATLPCAALTAWHALFEAGACGPGTVVLTLGTGGVSMFAVQLARAAGATVMATSSDATKLARLHDMGVAHAVNYREEPAWGDRVRALTPGEEGVDLVVEVGGQGTLDQSMRAVRPGGTIALIGTLAGPSPVNLAPLYLRNIRLQGTLVGSREMFVRMCAAFSRWQIQPVVDRVFDFEDAPAAYAHLASGAHMGKVVVRVGGSH
jgi:NADPH:quinone reductase-like Zn-dependent oxidoreductase